jgi:uncharacterized membrane protein
VSEANVAQPIQTSIPTVPSKGLGARAFGVFFSPRATYAAIAARPQALGALLSVVVIVSGATAMFLSTEVGQNAYIDQALSSMEGFGRQVNDQQMNGIERMAPYAAYITGGAQLVFIPIVAVIISPLLSRKRMTSAAVRFSLGANSWADTPRSTMMVPSGTGALVAV